MLTKTKGKRMKSSGNLSNATDTVALPRHRWYYYKEGFSPNLVNKAIKELKLSSDDLVIDPFNGSGTVTLTCAMQGVPSVGVEVNPFTAFIARTKATDVNAQQFEIYANQLLTFIKNDKYTVSRWVGLSTFTERDNLDKWLFNRSVADAYESGFGFLESVRVSEVRDVLKLALISSLMTNANARRDGKCFKYRKDWEVAGFNKETFVDTLSHKLVICLEDLRKTSIIEKPQVICEDSRKFFKRNNNQTYSLCITSPPYLNTFDYTDIYRPELFLGGFISSNEALYQLRLNTVRSHVQALWPSPKEQDFGSDYNRIMEHLLDHENLLMSKRIPLMVQAYFEDMKDILQSLYTKMKKGAQTWIVVSTSAYAGIEVPVDNIIGYIGEKIGFDSIRITKLRDIRKRKTKNSGNISFLRESLVVLERN